MHKASTDRRTSNNHHRALKCIVLLALVKVGPALKLTPVHHPSRKLLLDQESKSITLAFNEAKELISSETNPSSETSISHLIQNRVIKRLHTSIERWSLIEDRLRSAVSTSDQMQISMFDETLSIIAASRVLLGQLFWRSHDNDAALRELEPSCPILWDYDVEKISLDNDGWLDCYSTLGDIYVRMGRLEQAVELEKALTLRMPWLTLTFSGKPTNSKFQTLATISHLTRITREERRSISAFIKNAWKRAEVLRSQLNELVSEFVHADTDKRRMNVYTRTQHIVEKTLQRFVKDSNVTILQYSEKASKESTENNVISLPTMSSNDSLSSSSSASERLSRIEAAETEYQLKRREATLLNSALRVEINREASFYLSTMDGIIEGGKHFIPAVRIRDEENTNGRFQSEVAANLGRESYSSFGNSLSSSSISAAPMGFQSRDQVMQVFEYLLAHQSERQEQIDSSKTSPNAAAARASRRAATAQSEKVKESKTSSRKSATSTQKQQPQVHGKNSFSDSDTENSTTPSDTYGFAGIYMALFAGSGFLLHSARSKSQQYSDTATMKSRRDRVPLPKSIKYGPTGKKSDEIEKQQTNFLWTSLTACLGPAASSNLPPIVEGLCHFLSRLILKILAFLGYILAFRTTARCNYSSVTKIIQQVKNKLDVFTELRGQHASTPATTSSPTSKKIPSNKVTKTNEDSMLSTHTKKQKSSPTTNKKGINESKISTDNSSGVQKVKRTSKKLQVVTSHDENVTAQPIETFIAFCSSSSSSPDIQSPDNTATTVPTTPLMENTRTTDLSNLKIAFHEADLEKLDDAPASPSSQSNSESTSGETLADDKVFDDCYWRSQDEQEVEESGWIESSAQSRGKARRALGLEKAAHLSPTESRPKVRQQPLQIQHDRKAAESAFSSASASVRDRHPNASQQLIRKTQPLRRAPPSNHSPHSAPSSSSMPSTSAAITPTAPPAQQKEISLSATSALKSILARKAPARTQLPLISTQDTHCHEFPPLRSIPDSQFQGRSSSTENSTDMEDHSTVSGGSHLCSPRSRSPSISQDPPAFFEEEPLAGHLMHAHPNSLLQMPFCPMGFMPMHMANMPQLMYNPPMVPIMGPGSQHFTPTVQNNMTQEQQQALLQQHQQAMMMMPFSPMYLLPQHGFEAPSNIHFRNLSEEQTMYNAQMGNQIFLDSLLHAQNQHNVAHIQQSEHHLPNVTAPETANIFSSETEIVDLVRRQIEYYFSSDNLCHDNYLRSKMDAEGFVYLSEICNWNRIRRTGASPEMLLEAVKSSVVLQVAEEWESSANAGETEGVAPTVSGNVLATRIRCAENPLFWIQHQTSSSGEEIM